MSKSLSVFLMCALFLAACHPDIRDIRAQRKTYRAGFLKDERSPLGKADLKDLDFFPPNVKGRVLATVHLTPDAEPFEMPTYSGITRTYRKWAELRFTWEGDMRLRLAVYENLTLRNPIYADYLFLPFKDATNSVSTYGGGRYMNLSKQDAADGEVLLDFNTCYNPWCAYSEGFNCPIPPVENHLIVA